MWKLRNVTGRNANWRDHGKTLVQECTTTEKADILWEAFESRRVKGRDLWKKNEGVRERMKSGMRGIRTRREGEAWGWVLGVTDGTHPDPDPEGRGNELWDSSELGQAGIFAQQLSVVQHLRSSRLLPIRPNPHPSAHIPRVLSLIGLNAVDHVFPSGNSLLGYSGTSDSWLFWS